MQYRAVKNIKIELPRPPNLASLSIALVIYLSNLVPSGPSINTKAVMNSEASFRPGFDSVKITVLVYFTLTYFFDLDPSIKGLSSMSTRFFSNVISVMGNNYSELATSLSRVE